MISSTKLKDSVKDPTYCYANTNNLIDHILTNKSLYKKPYWVIIKSQTGNSLRTYNCRFVKTEVMKDFPKMTKIYIDDEILYVHRANINIIDSKLIK